MINAKIRITAHQSDNRAIQHHRMHSTLIQSQGFHFNIQFSLLINWKNKYLKPIQQEHHEKP